MLFQPTNSYKMCTFINFLKCASFSQRPYCWFYSHVLCSHCIYTRASYVLLYQHSSKGYLKIEPILFSTFYNLLHLFTETSIIVVTSLIFHVLIADLFWYVISLRARHCEIGITTYCVPTIKTDWYRNCFINAVFVFNLF